jgi:hypothetical protein
MGQSSLLALLATALLGAGLAACGGAGKGTTSASQVSLNSSMQSKRDADDDNDNPTGSRYDSDDDFGPVASAADERAIVAVVKRYYAAAAAGNGAKACSLLYALLAETVVEEYGHLPTLRGDTCAAVLSKLFAKNHQELETKVARLRPTRILVNGARGWALLSFGTTYERRVFVHREGRAWKIDVLLDAGMT